MPARAEVRYDSDRRPPMHPFEDVIESEEQLRALLGTPGPRAVLKERAALDQHMRAFIARSPMVLVATADRNGRCDVSPKGDGPGFVLVLDERRLAIPDRPGNKRFDGMRNILENPQVGLIFLIPGREETLRVNGRAFITRDPDILERSAVQGKIPPLAIGVEVEQCFLHCAKAFRRARFWAVEHWPAADALPSLGCMLFDQIKPEGMTAQDYERDLESNIKHHLY
jgi:PPOX class probable FMN-dependent enzyme